MELKRNTVGQLSFWTSVLILQIHVLHVFVVFPTLNLPKYLQAKKEWNNLDIWFHSFILRFNCSFFLHLQLWIFAV